MLTRQKLRFHLLRCPIQDIEGPGMRIGACMHKQRLGVAGCSDKVDQGSRGQSSTERSSKLLEFGIEINGPRAIVCIAVTDHRKPAVDTDDIVDIDLVMTCYERLGAGSIQANAIKRVAPV